MQDKRKTKCHRKRITLRKKLHTFKIRCDRNGKRQITEEISVINLQRIEISECNYTKGAIIRSRARWNNDGEKNTKYFLNLQKRHLKQKTMHLSDYEVINTEEEILKEAKSFYQKLSVSSIDNQCDEIFFPLGNIATLTERERNECGCLLTEAECLKSIQPNRSFSLSRNKKINRKPSSGNSQEFVML